MAVLLVSADFLASDFIAIKELPPLLAAAEQEGLLVLPVIFKPCRFTRTPILKDFQAVNQPSKSLLGLSEFEQESIWVQVSDRIEEFLHSPLPNRTDRSKPKPSQSFTTGTQPKNKPLNLKKFRFDVVNLELTAGSKVKLNRSSHEAEYYSEKLGNGTTLEMVSIPGGTFQMGSPITEKERRESEGPQRYVAVAPFFMGKYPIKQGQWKAVAASPQIDRELEPDPSRFKGFNRPVEQVSWYEAVEFCARLSNLTGRDYRLPTEAEWEYACRAETATPFHFGETMTTELANYNGNYTYHSGPKGKYRKETTEGIFPPDRFGLHDMHGNVWEWCAEPWHKSYAGALPEGTLWNEGGNESIRVLRGGSRNSNPQNCRSANRGGGAPGSCDNVIGFRVACSPAKSS